MKLGLFVLLALVSCGEAFAAFGKPGENPVAAAHRDNGRRYERSVPEPAALLLLGVGGGIAFGVRRLRRKRNSVTAPPASAPARNSPAE
jgi:hypothetical protein